MSSPVLVAVEEHATPVRVLRGDGPDVEVVEVPELDAMAAGAVDCDTIDLS